MKQQIRVLGIDDASYDRNIHKKTFVIGTIFRGGDFLDGIITCEIRIDGKDATKNIADMINKSKFKVQLRAILLDGIAVGGFNVIDITELNRKTNIPVIVIMRGYPDIEKIKKALLKIGMKNKIKLIEKAGKIYSYEKIHFQFFGLAKEKAEKILELTCTHSDIPEPIRIAHLIGQGIVFGESKGRA